jgi:hypothetical protein
MTRIRTLALVGLFAITASCSKAESSNDREANGALVSPRNQELARFISEVNKCGLAVPVPNVKSGDGGPRVYYDVNSKTIVAPTWEDLSTAGRRQYENRPNLIRSKFLSAEEEFSYLGQFLIIHEAAHYVTYDNNLSLNPFWGEVEANKIAIAYFKKIQPNTYENFILDLINWYGITEDQISGIDQSNIEEWFNRNYGLRMTPEQYGWIQQETLKDLIHDSANSDIELCKIMLDQRAFVLNNEEARIK